MHEVHVTNPEILLAAHVGCLRNITSYRDAKDKHGADTQRDGWQGNVMGAIGELAWAKTMGVFWGGAIGNYKAGDVGEHFQIRSTSIVNRKKAMLLMHKTDEDDKPYILALVGMKNVLFVGYYFGREGKQDHYWGDHFQNGRPCYGIPHQTLHPIEDLLVGKNGRSG